MPIARKLSVGLAWLAAIMLGATLIFIFLDKPPRKIKKEAPPATAVLKPHEIKKEAQPAAAAFNFPAPPNEGAKNYFPIAENGQARCVVVHPKDAPAIQRMAEALRAYLERATGAPIKLIPDSAPAPEGLAQIHVGDTVMGTNTPLDLPDVRCGKDAFPNLNGYLVKTLDQRTLVIRGLTGKATAQGIVGFLKRYAGIRQYWECAPGSIGEVVPSRPTLSIPQVEWRDWPCFFSRVLSQRPFTPASGPLDFLRRNNTLPCSENYSELLPPKKYAKEHPEYFPMRNGKRFVPAEDEDSSWQPCVSNPDVARIMAEAVIEYFRKNPGAVGMNVSVNDGGGDCDCAECRAMDTPGAEFARRRSDRYIRFTNKICEQVEREFPSKLIVLLAYNATAYPPVTVKPHRMILPVITVAGRNALQAWDEWMAAGPEHMGFYLHHDDALFFILPKLDLHQQARRIRHAVDSGRARAVYMEAKPYWPLSGLVSYITAELLWDPRQDVDTLLDEFYTTFFGPAAAPMKTFYGTLESGYERWLAENGLPYAAGKDISSLAGGRSFKQFNVLTADEAHKAAAALKTAAALAAGDALAAKRVEAVQRMFAIVAPCVETYWTTDRLNREAVTSEAEARAVVESARRIFAVSHAMREHIATVLDKTPPELYGAVFSKPGNKRPVELYEALKTGRPGPESIAAIKKGADAVNAWLRTARGPDAAVRWWDEVIAAESAKELAGIFKMARLAGGAGELKAIYRSKFDEVGRELAPPDLDIQAGDQVIVIDQFMESGRTNNYQGAKILQDAQFTFRAWKRDRTPFTLGLTRKDVPGNVFALMAQHMYRARLACQAPVTPGARQFRVGFSFKRNAGPGQYTAEILYSVDKNRQDAKKSMTAATLAIPDQPDVWHDVAANVELPEDAKSLIIFVFVGGQAPDAKCWLADVFMSEYANKATGATPAHISP